MPEPHDTLSIFAEVSIALTGFSGIVVAFDRRRLVSLSKPERRRLSNLFFQSGMVLTLSLIGISLLHLEITDPALLWRMGSVLVFLCTTPWLIWDIVKVRRLNATEKLEVNSYVLYSFNAVTISMLVLQLFNWFAINEAWPFFLALALAIFGAFQQFILLVTARLRGTPETS